MKEGYPSRFEELTSGLSLPAATLTAATLAAATFLAAEAAEARGAALRPEVSESNPPGTFFVEGTPRNGSMGGYLLYHEEPEEERTDEDGNPNEKPEETAYRKAHRQLVFHVTGSEKGKGPKKGKLAIFADRTQIKELREMGIRVQFGARVIERNITVPRSDKETGTFGFAGRTFLASPVFSIDLEIPEGTHQLIVDTSRGKLSTVVGISGLSVTQAGVRAEKAAPPLPPDAVSEEQDDILERPAAFNAAVTVSRTPNDGFDVRWVSEVSVPDLSAPKITPIRGQKDLVAIEVYSLRGEGSSEAPVTYRGIAKLGIPGYLVRFDRVLPRSRSEEGAKMPDEFPLDLVWALDAEAPVKIPPSEAERARTAEAAVRDVERELEAAEAVSRRAERELEAAEAVSRRAAHDARVARQEAERARSEAERASKDKKEKLLEGAKQKETDARHEERRERTYAEQARKAAHDAVFARSEAERLRAEAEKARRAAEAAIRVLSLRIQGLIMERLSDGPEPPVSLNCFSFNGAGGVASGEGRPSGGGHGVFYCETPGRPTGVARVLLPLDQRFLTDPQCVKAIQGLSGSDRVRFDRDRVDTLPLACRDGTRSKINAWSVRARQRR